MILTRQHVAFCQRTLLSFFFPSIFLAPPAEKKFPWKFFSNDFNSKIQLTEECFAAVAAFVPFPLVRNSMGFSSSDPYFALLSTDLLRLVYDDEFGSHARLTSGLVYDLSQKSINRTIKAPLLTFTNVFLLFPFLTFRRIFFIIWCNYSGLYFRACINVIKSFRCLYYFPKIINRHVFFISRTFSEETENFESTKKLKIKPQLFFCPLEPFKNATEVILMLKQRRQAEKIQKAVMKAWFWEVWPFLKFSVKPVNYTIIKFAWFKNESL